MKIIVNSEKFRWLVVETTENLFFKNISKLKLHLNTIKP